jgi:hypothetical protein
VDSLAVVVEEAEGFNSGLDLAGLDQHGKGGTALVRRRSAMSAKNNIVLIRTLFHPGRALSGTHRGKACAFYLINLQFGPAPGESARSCRRFELKRF